LLPNLPTMAESGVPGFELTAVHGLFAPAGTPTDIVGVLNRETTRVMSEPIMKERLAADGAEAAPPNSPSEYRESVVSNMVALSNFIKASGFKAD
jgi:tripartite-type tricarboxylate transporter receptor subunit TctC